MNSNFQNWLEEHYIPVYYSSVWQSKANKDAEYSDMELEEIYNSIIKYELSK